MEKRGGEVLLDGTEKRFWEREGQRHAPRVEDQLDQLLHENERERRVERQQRGGDRTRRGGGGGGGEAATARKHLALLRHKQDRRRAGLGSGSRNKQR